MPSAYRTAGIARMKTMVASASFQLPTSILSFMAASIAVFALAGCQRTPELTRQQTEGKHLYEVRCAHCHRDNDLALKKVPPDLHGMFNRGTLPSGAASTDANIRTVVLAGKGMMPAFAGRFDDVQMAALLAYLHTGLR